MQFPHLCGKPSLHVSSCEIMPSLRNPLPLMLRLDPIFRLQKRLPHPCTHRTQAHTWCGSAVVERWMESAFKANMSCMMMCVFVQRAQGAWGSIITFSMHRFSCVRSWFCFSKTTNIRTIFNFPGQEFEGENVSVFVLSKQQEGASLSLSFLLLPPCPDRMEFCK